MSGTPLHAALTTTKGRWLSCFVVPLPFKLLLALTSLLLGHQMGTCIDTSSQSGAHIQQPAPGKEGPQGVSKALHCCL